MDKDDRESIVEAIDEPNMNRSTIRSAIGFFEDLLRGCETPNIAVRIWGQAVSGLAGQVIDATMTV